MKTIGMIGGMSWESSIEYYRIINELVKARLGDLHSADCLMYSVDFAEIEVLQQAGDWDQLTQDMISAAQRLERGGAACVVICTTPCIKWRRKSNPPYRFPSCILRMQPALQSRLKV